jgi:hypothetical protein
MVSVLAMGPKVRGLKPGRGYRFSAEIKIRTTPYYVGEVKRDTVQSYTGLVRKN